MPRLADDVKGFALRRDVDVDFGPRRRLSERLHQLQGDFPHRLKALPATGKLICTLVDCASLGSLQLLLE